MRRQRTKRQQWGLKAPVSEGRPVCKLQRQVRQLLVSVFALSLSSYRIWPGRGRVVIYWVVQLPLPLPVVRSLQCVNKPITQRTPSVTMLSCPRNPPAQYAPNNPANPFGNQAEVNRQLANSGPDMNTPPIVPAPLSVRSPSPVSQSSIGPGTMAVGGVAAAGAMAGHRGDAPKPLNLSPNRAASPAPGQPSPAGTEFSMTSVSAGALANGPPPSNVHRVQMDFKPSMDDELGLRAGQLVRLLHEYDDGWVSSGFNTPIVQYVLMIL